MRVEIKIFLIMLPLLLITFFAQAQTQYKGMTLPIWGIKSNLLYDATMTINLGVELRTGEKTSFDIPVNYNAWTFSDNKKWKHILVQPEFRFWPKETFRGHFFGLHGHYAFYNVGALANPPFSEYVNTHRFEGWLAGAGLSYGYRWNVNRRWALEATIGGGYAYIAHNNFPCYRCGERIGSETKHYIGPTKVGISLMYGFGRKRAQPQLERGYIEALPPVVIQEPYEPKLYASFVVPQVDSVKVRRDISVTYLNFRLGRFKIVPEFKNNARELLRIHDIIRKVVTDPDATITGIAITGYASPDGSFAVNMDLSEKRTKSVKDHIKSIYGFRERFYTVHGAGEDRNMLDSLVSRSEMAYKDEILTIIRATDVFDGREKKLMDLAEGNPYRQMKVELFPQLRRVEYRIGYTIAPFTVENGKNTIIIRPGSRSLNEMFLVANTYQPRSEDYNRVFEIVVQIYPDSDVANINAAANALSRGNAVLANFYIGKVTERTEAWWNNMGMLAWMQGNKERATECFTKAGMEGTANALELNRHLMSCK